MLEYKPSTPAPKQLMLEYKPSAPLPDNIDLNALDFGMRLRRSYKKKLNKNQKWLDRHHKEFEKNSFFGMRFRRS
jgi:hypothetical protein